MINQYEIGELDSNTNGTPFYVFQSNSRARYGGEFLWAKSQEEATEILEKVIRKEEERQASMDAVKAERKADQAKDLAEMIEKCDIGAMLGTSWGYEQTNREFYQVVGRFGKRGIEIREVAKIDVTGNEKCGPFAGKCKSAPGEFIGPVMRKQIGAYGVKVSDHRTAHIVDHGKAYHYSWGY